MKFVCETKSNKSSKLIGPIVDGWPSIHLSLIVEAPSEGEAKAIFEKRFPNDVLGVYQD